MENYTSGGATGVNVTGYRRVIDGGRGYFQYKGATLDTGSDYESSLGILNGANAPGDPNQILENNLFKENFLVLIDSTYYAISEWDANTITLQGITPTWKTTGTSVSFSILKYEKQEADIDERPHLPHPMPGHYFGKLEATGDTWESDKLDRSDNEVIEITIEQDGGVPFMAAALNANKSGNELNDPVKQEENVTYTIEWFDEGD
jgi:hypothetical protein